MTRPGGEATGLRRFARPRPAAWPNLSTPNGPVPLLSGSRPPGPHVPGPHVPGPHSPGQAEPADRCDLCATALGPRHGHVVALDSRALRCVCRACYLLFTPDGAGAGRFRAVPQRYLHDPDRRLTDEDWTALEIPVTTAFLFVNSELRRVVACYPSPAGATECLLDLESWQRLRHIYPLLAAPAPDVEAVFVTAAAIGLDSFVVPIDACYRLVGEVRLRWRGIDGGEPVRRVLATFVDDLRARSRPVSHK
jgi:hypothetical protein